MPRPGRISNLGWKKFGLDKNPIDYNLCLKRLFETVVCLGGLALAIDETRTRLLQAAGVEFAEKGFEGATVRAICDRAGVNLAAVNYHFGDKERLYEEVVMLAHRQRAEPDFDPTVGDPRHSLRNYVAHFVHQLVAIRELPWHQEVMLREIALPSKASDKLVDEAFRPDFEVLMAILRRLCPEADGRQIHAIGFSVIAQCLHYKICAPISERIIGPEAFKRLDADYLVEHITRFTLSALGHGEPLTVANHNSADASAGPTDRG